MTDTPRSPTPSRRVIRWTLRAAGLLAAGVAAYVGLELLDGALIDSLDGGPDDALIEVVEIPEELGAPSPASTEGPGNRILRQASAGIDARRSVVVRVDQKGWLDGAPVQSTGRYLQLGGGTDRQFLLEQTGSLAGLPTRLLRISDGLDLFTDLAWGDPSSPQRSVSRVNLRELRRLNRDLLGTGSQGDPSLWSRFGGLPMLFAGLDQAFAFGQPRLMQLRQQRVLAMVGRWRPEHVAKLAGEASDGLPPRAPQHVVVALGEEDLFPLLVEYRDARDPLSAGGLPDEALLTASQRPLLKIELGPPTYDERLDERLFVYDSSGVDCADETDRELQLARNASDRSVVQR